jgi:hypothetical protein
MSQLFDTPGAAGGVAEIPRDHWKRPLVVPEGGGKPVPYTRCTTFVDVLDDKYNLQRWQLRQVALGLADRPDLILSVSAYRDDKAALNRIADQALEAAKSGAAATTGTALHALTERRDRGQAIGVVPAAYRADLTAYAAATGGMEHVGIEVFTVHDGYRIGGTPDRVVKFRGRYYIADVKTGEISYGGLKIAMQLAVYANSTLYTATGGRHPYPWPVDTERAIVIHLPAGQGFCSLHWVNIAAGWEAVETASMVRGWRARKDWYTPVPPDDRPALSTALSEVDIAISNAATIDELRMVWTKAIAAQTWTDEHLQKALVRKQQLERVAS